VVWELLASDNACVTPDGLSIETHVALFVARYGTTRVKPWELKILVKNLRHFAGARPQADRLGVPLPFIPRRISSSNVIPVRLYPAKRWSVVMVSTSRTFSSRNDVHVSLRAAGSYGAAVIFVMKSSRDAGADARSATRASRSSS
jgi:hypothetical protein